MSMESIYTALRRFLALDLCQDWDDDDPDDPYEAEVL